jgi:hypothetical protein
LAALQVEYEAAFHLTFHAAELMGKEEVGVATDDERAVLRLLTPVVKLYTARQAIASASEVIEAFGGAGYVEDTGIPRHLRDAQVLSIWEGTTNVLSLDVLRAIDKDEAFRPFMNDLRRRLEDIQSPLLRDLVQRVRTAAVQIEAHAQNAHGDTTDYREAGARAFSYSLARTYAASLLLEHADWQLEHENDSRGAEVSARWCVRDLAPLVDPDPEHREISERLAADE